MLLRISARTRAPKQSPGLFLLLFAIALFEPLTINYKTNKPPVEGACLFGRDGEVRKALPSVCYANTDCVRLRREEFEPLKGIIATSKKEIPKGISFLLAGMARFELTDDGVKVRCLTAWLHPYIKNVKHQTKV